jgi:hypothetical protein
VAAASLVGKKARDDVSDKRLHARDHGGERVIIISGADDVRGG